MVISNSSIAMESKNSSFYYAQSKTLTLEEKAGTEIKLDTHEGADSLTEQVTNHLKEKEEQEKEQEKISKAIYIKQMRKTLQDENCKAKENSKVMDFSKENPDITLLRLILKGLNRKLHGADIYSYENFSKNKNLFVNNINNDNSQLIDTSAGGFVSQMVRTTVTSTFETGSENTAFVASGTACTADGRKIDFGITLELSKSFTREYEGFSKENYFCTDPLIINVGSETAKISDQKFMFDLDADGKEDEISFAENGSGFLAYDKNDDGVINDGTELFGTKSGDGFRDLAEYDNDGNGWIDEADEIFKKLRVWTKDENGNDKLISLREADVGAIYLGNAKTNFTLENTETYDKNGILRETGIFLKESGGAGTIQHVDLTL